jgi:hypothetical protein
VRRRRSTLIVNAQVLGRGICVLVTLALVSVACGKAVENDQAREPFSSPQPDPESEHQVEVVEPKSLSALERPYVSLLVKVTAPNGRAARMAANGILFNRQKGTYTSAVPIPLRREGGWIQIVVDWGMPAGRETICLPYTCAVHVSHDLEMADLLASIESPVGQQAAGAYLRLRAMVDPAYFDTVDVRLRQSSDVNAQRRLAMLLGDWRAPSAVPTLLDTWRDHGNEKIREVCEIALGQIAEGLGLGAVGGHERTRRLQLLPLVPQLMAERFPKDCTSTTVPRPSK